MPRPKKGSPEAKAWAADMKARREQAKQTPQTNQEEPVQEDIVQDDNVTLLLKRIEELEKRQFFPPAPQGAPAPRTVVTKYSFNAADYPDPTERFYTEPKLTLKGFTKDWWNLGWEVQRVNYEEDGTKYAAPRFLLELKRVIEDAETGLPTNREYVLKRGMFFEDPDSFIHIANQAGVDVPETLEKSFLDEMRYMCMRDWLIESFYPPKVTKKQQGREEVIGNRLVTVMEINSPNAEGMPFDQMK